MILLDTLRQQITLPRWIQGLSFAISELRCVARALLKFGNTGVMQPEAYQAMVRLFCRTRGYSNDFFHSILRFKYPPKTIKLTSQLLNEINFAGLQSVTKSLKREGYFVFKSHIPDRLCDPILDFARQTPANLRHSKLSLSETALYDENTQAKADQYFFPENLVLQCPAVLEILSDPGFILTAQKYLGCEPVLDIVSLAWNAPYSRTINDHLGQRYHFDMDRIKWIKFFIFITGLSNDNGCHYFIRGTHRSGTQPKALLERGYARIEDQEIFSHYSSSQEIRFFGPRGMILAEDTRGFHKGAPALNSPRLLLEFEFCDSLFGGQYQQTALKLQKGSGLCHLVQKFPRVFSKFDISMGA